MTIYTDARAVTPSDTDPVRCQGFMAGGPGNVTIVPKPGAEPVTFTAVKPGVAYPVNCYLITASGTTAPNIMGL